VERVKAGVILLAAFMAAASSKAPQLVDISYDEKTPQRRQAVKFQAMDVVLIELEKGPRAVVQFTELQARRGTYRWRFRRAKTDEILSGVGTVAERYEEIPDGPKRGHTLPLPGNDKIVRVGDIRAAWSWADDQVAYLYYHTKHAKVTVLPAESFDKEL
jgi:hypothetical protein